MSACSGSEAASTPHEENAMPETVVIVGASLAGATAAAELRRLEFAGRIVLIGEEAHRPYERPPLTKQLLRGESQPSDAAVFEPRFAIEHDIELRIGTRVDAIEPESSSIVLADGTLVLYDQLLLTTGARPRRLDIAGAGLASILTVRTLEDMLVLREHLGPGYKLVVVGGGWIGTEIAASASEVGTEVVLIEGAAAPLEHVLGHEMGDLFATLHREHGVDVRTGCRVGAFEGTTAVRAVRLDSGEQIDCDVVVVGIGVVPATELADRAGLETADGIVVDSLLRTSDPKILAAGDVALVDHPRYGPLRIEHWENARRQGRAAAATIVGRGQPFDAIPYFFSDQYDVGLEYTGLASPESEFVIRGTTSSREFVAFWLDQERVIAGMNVNVLDVADDIRQLIENDAVVDPAQLADPTVALGDLAAAGV
jgi:3-phenylpropionate/trans-cinnamate dioxygenase ferredoxin reductase subunit